MFRTSNLQLIQRTVLVLTLLVVAHSIRPFTVSRISRQLLRTANLLSFMLPGQAVVSLHQADYLAMMLDGEPADATRSAETLKADASEGLLARINESNEVMSVNTMPQVMALPSSCSGKARPSVQSHQQNHSPLAQRRGHATAMASALSDKQAAEKQETADLGESAEAESFSESAEADVIMELPSPSVRQSGVVSAETPSFEALPFSDQTETIPLPEVLKKSSQSVNKCTPDVLKQGIRNTIQEPEEENIQGATQDAVQFAPVVIQMNPQNRQAVYVRLRAVMQRRDLDRIQLLKKKAAAFSKC